MRGTTHARTGRAAWFYVAPLTGAGLALSGTSLEDLALFATGLIVATGAAYGPDIDNRWSTARHNVPAGGAVSALASKVFGGHRVGTHSLLSILVTGLITGGAAWWFASLEVLPWSAIHFGTVIGVSVATGWASHIFGDLLTERGCALFYPLSRKRVRIMRLKTSKPKPASMNFGEFIFNLTLVIAQVYAVLLIINT